MHFILTEGLKMNSVKLNSEDGQTCSLYLFRNVKNSLEIRGKLLKGQIDATIINAKLIPDLLQIFVAANKASIGKKLTKTIHTEVLYNLSPSKSVTESLKIFGIDENIEDLIVLIFENDNTDQSKVQSVKDLIQGDLVNLEQHNEIIDWEKIAKLHGIPENTNHEIICDLAVSKSAAKDFLL